MKLNQLAKLSIGFIKHPVYSGNLLLHDSNLICEPDINHVREAADWLILSQKMSLDGAGYSRKYSLLTGWDKGYIETTGYIIPTMFNVANYLSDDIYKVSAYDAGEWLLTKQLGNGAFPDIDEGRPQVFDTGQVLLGINALITEGKGDSFLESGIEAADWLINTQDDNGAWSTFAYNRMSHSYYSRVSAALIQFADISGRKQYKQAGIKNLEWVVSQQQSNGYFQHCEFLQGENALLHTIIYVIEGLLMAYDSTGEERWLRAALNSIDALLKGITNEQPILFSQYNQELYPTNKEFCITGLAQWAGVCIDAYKITNNKKYLNTCKTTLKYLCSIQRHNGKDILGALPSSMPFWGYYGSMAFYNWNTKFFIDSMIKFLEIENK